jgi:hypothetical protein
MSLSDKILELLKEGPASSRQLYEKLKKQGCTDNIRTIQRRILKLQHEELIHGNAFGREILYSLSTPRSPTIADYFLNKFWNEMFEIQQETGVQELPIKAYSKLRSLVMLLPQNIKEKIVPRIKSIDSRLSPNVSNFGIRYIGFSPDASKDGKITYSENFKREIESVLDELSSLLHEKIKSENTNEDAKPQA